jgi:hypothetical protein
VTADFAVALSPMTRRCRGCVAAIATWPSSEQRGRIAVAVAATTATAVPPSPPSIPLRQRGDMIDVNKKPGTCLKENSNDVRISRRYDQLGEKVHDDFVSNTRSSDTAQRNRGC